MVSHVLLSQGRGDQCADFRLIQLSGRRQGLLEDLWRNSQWRYRADLSPAYAAQALPIQFLDSVACPDWVRLFYHQSPVSLALHVSLLVAQQPSRLALGP